MKQETNKEMELLLRRLARRDNTGAPENKGNAISERHMDADELSAFAEHALPAAARARYTEHLAECGRCREIVVGISASLGHPVVEEVKTPVERSSVKSLLASFFSPVFIRYAIPAVALIGIIGLGLIVFRQSEIERRPAMDQVAQSNQPNAGAAPTQDYRSGRSDVAPRVAPTPQANSTPQQEQPAVKGEVQKEGKAEVTAPKEVAAAPPAPVVAEPKPAKLADEEVARREAEAQRKPVTVDGQDQADSVARARDKADSNKEDSKKEVRTYDGLADASSRPAKSPAKVSDNKNEVAQNAPSAARGAGSSVDSVKRRDAAEVRSVAGRHFHREGNAWIDTAYEPGRGTTNVSRGSEQYRALIADEPEIRTIAESLSGEVIVVWKGHAYRLR